MAITTVFQDAWDASRRSVYGYAVNVGGSSTPIEIDLVETPVLDVTVTKLGATYFKPINFTVFPELTVTNVMTKELTFVVTPTLEITAATTILGVGEFVVSPSMSLSLRDGTTIALTQTPVLDVELTFISGSSHSTFFKEFDFVVTPTIEVGRGSQSYFDLLQTPDLEVTFEASIGSHTTYAFKPFDLVVTPILDVALSTVILPLPVIGEGPHPVGRPATTGWLLEQERRKKEPPGPSEVAQREQRRLAAIAAARAAEAAAIAARKRAAEERVAAIAKAMQPMDVMDAAFKGVYEQQIAQMGQMNQAAGAEIMRLRTELAAAQQAAAQGNEQDNEDAAVALLLLKQ